MSKPSPTKSSTDSDASKFRDGPIKPLLMLTLPLLYWLSGTDLDNFQREQTMVPATALVLLLAYGILWPGKHRWARRIALAGMGLGFFAMMAWNYSEMVKATGDAGYSHVFVLGALVIPAGVAVLGLCYCITGRVPLWDRIKM